MLVDDAVKVACLYSRHQICPRHSACAVPSRGAPAFKTHTGRRALGFRLVRVILTELPAVAAAMATWSVCPCPCQLPVWLAAESV